jgi:DNA repair ATPase RecN
MNKRIIIEKLIVTGIGVKEASLSFTKGVNLIIGSSDSGKSYIFQCIDYLLGAGDCPKTDIPESNGYSDAFLQIKTNDNKVFTIHRNLKSVSKVTITESVFEKHLISTKRILGTKNGTLEGENISDFLLNLIDIKDVSLKTNASNKTRMISFRDISHLTLIDETKIITEGSPVYYSNGNYGALTGEKSAFKHLLTGHNDSELIEQEEKKVFESRIKGKIEYIDTLVLSKNEKIAELQESVSNLTSEQINKKISQLLENLNKSTNTIENLTKAREIKYVDFQKEKSNNLRDRETLKRFYLLYDHYKNDLNRLNFILEGDFLF